MKRQEQKAGGFTLIELMIVVAICGILAAVALPNFRAMQLRAKRSEIPGNLDGICTAEKVYGHEWDVYTACGPNPVTVPSKEVVPFGDTTCWELLGIDVKAWTVRAQYRVDVGATNAVSQSFSAQAYADIDGDGTQSLYVCGISETTRNESNSYTRVTMMTPNSVY